MEQTGLSVGLAAAEPAAIISDGFTQRRPLRGQGKERGGSNPKE